MDLKIMSGKTESERARDTDRQTDGQIADLERPSPPSTSQLRSAGCRLSSGGCLLVSVHSNATRRDGISRVSRIGTDEKMMVAFCCFCFQIASPRQCLRSTLSQISLFNSTWLGSARLD